MIFTASLFSANLTTAERSGRNSMPNQCIGQWYQPSATQVIRLFQQARNRAPPTTGGETHIQQENRQGQQPDEEAKWSQENRHDETRDRDNREGRYPGCRIC